MLDDMLFGRDLERHVERVKEVAREAAELRHRKFHQLPLRDMSAWTALRAAQQWIAGHEAPRRAWQAERVRRVALQIGYARPVMEGSHVGLVRPSMSFNQLTHEVAVFPEGIVSRRVPPIASSLLHEATHHVTREIFCERFNVSSDEAFVMCDLNAREAPRTVFTAEALAFWNQACWMLAGSPEDVGECGHHEMVIHATHAINRPHEAMGDFAAALMHYTHVALHGRSLDLDMPFVHLSGSRAGLPIVVTDLAPTILEPLVKIVGL